VTINATTQTEDNAKLINHLTGVTPNVTIQKKTIANPSTIYLADHKRYNTNNTMAVP
jgi:hypothetical protein